MGLLEGRVVSAMVLNHSHAPQYDKVRWALDLKDRDFFVLHALGVDPDVAGKGIGSGMIREAVRSAREKGAGALRLDVLNTNEPAEKLYLRNGFQYRGEAELFYENTGRRIFRMYELVL
jgi:ribosomal protein S18 acetylase RimI-like enzyme